MTEEERCFVDSVQEIKADIQKGGYKTTMTSGLLWADAELSRLRTLATRWYLADGSYETLPEEEVIRRRKEAAVTLSRAEAIEKRAGDVEGMAKALWEDDLVHKMWTAKSVASKIRDHILGRG